MVYVKKYILNRGDRFIEQGKFLSINDKIRMYKKWKIKMYNFVQNYFQKNVHFYIDINTIKCVVAE